MHKSDLLPLIEEALDPNPSPNSTAGLSKRGLQTFSNLMRWRLQQ
jgi:hypothetical protein